MFKKHPLFIALLTICALVLIGGGALAFMAKSAAEAEAQRGDQLRRELQAALSRSPAPTAEHLAEAERNVEELVAVLRDQIQNVKGGRSISGSSAPRDKQLIYFQIEGFRDNFRNAAQRVEPLYVQADPNADGTEDNALQIPEAFDFGFSRLLDAGRPPEDSHVPIVYQQKEILTYLLRRLYEARPLRMVAVRREPAQEVYYRRNPDQRPKETRGSDPQAFRMAEDEFLMPPARSLRVEGAVDTLAFSITFASDSRTLRLFLTSLAAYDLPLVVRSVEVVPAETAIVVTEVQDDGPDDTLAALFGTAPDEGDDESDTEEQPADDGTRIPVVRENLSEFTVIVEYIELKVTDDPNPPPPALEAEGVDSNGTNDNA